MESAIMNLEQSVHKANGKLASITWKIDTFEKEFPDPDNEVSVLRLMRSVAQVKEEYQSLREEILEVQQLQKQLTASLKAQVSQVRGHYNILRERIVGHKKIPQLKLPMENLNHSKSHGRPFHRTAIIINIFMRFPDGSGRYLFREGSSEVTIKFSRTEICGLQFTKADPNVFNEIAIYIT